MPEIRPIKDLKNTNEISRVCHESNEPVYITKNGYGHLVVMSMETYKEKLAEAEMELNSKEELLDAEMVFEKLKNRYGEK